jgi:hypothetical protein
MRGSPAACTAALRSDCICAATCLAGCADLSLIKPASRFVTIVRHLDVQRCRVGDGMGAMHTFWILLAFYLALQLPLGIVIGDFCAQD